MKWRHWKFVGFTVFIGMAVCVAAYAGKCKKVSLPEAVKAAIDALYPQATIEEAKEEEEGLKVYEVELKQNGEKVELTVAPDGTIVEVQSEVAMANLPPAVAAAITQAAESAKIKEISQEVTYWVVVLKKLDAPETTYEAELIKDGKKSEIEVAADGTILEQSEWKGERAKKDDDDENEEEKLSIDQVPAAVKSTIVKEAAGGTIKEIETETEDGKTIYEAEVIINGQEVEIKVAADGTLLSKKAEDDDDDD
ncbi:MAG TPA: PepSY-like domain-containing protein [Sedimentisphaerales bacterium]|nr:PepSY-like domain-containing protein [Sedimentisphaerales bacterium]